MGLFNKKSDKGSFEELAELVNKSKDNDELVELAEQWEPNVEKYDIDYWFDNICSDNIKKIDFNKLPIVLDVFYKSNNKFKFILCCIILEATIDTLPYLTNLENERLFVEKWEILKTTISAIIKNSNSALIDCMYLIILNNDPTGDYLTEEEKNNIVEGINRNLEGIYNYLSNAEINPEVYKSIEVVFDISTYLNDSQTKELIDKISKLELNNQAIIFLLKYQLVNDIAIDTKNIDRILDNSIQNYNFFYMLDSIDKLNILEGKVNQETIALSKMVDWLIYPTELGELPTDIQKLDTIEAEGLNYYLFKFKSDKDAFKDKGYMLGIVGGYENNKLTANDSGIVFSNFEQVEKDYKNQGFKLIEQLENYWKQRVSELQDC